MDYVRLGACGLKVSRLCLGMMSYGNPAWREWMLNEDDAFPVVRRAVEHGVNFFDTADVYSSGASEEITGRLLGRLFNRRDDYVLATKVYSSTGPGPNDRGLSRKHILSAIDASLRRLGTDYVDLYQIHRWDPDTPIEETLQALDDVVRAGKARYLGASSMHAWQFAKAQLTAGHRGWTPFVAMQNHYNLIYREEEREMIPLCQDLGVGVLPWSPLARGWLTDHNRFGRPSPTARARSDALARELYEPEDRSIVDQVHAIATVRNVPMAQIALAWLLHNPAVTAPIVGAPKSSYVDDAVAALDVRLSNEDMALLNATYRPHPIRGHT